MALNNQFCVMFLLLTLLFEPIYCQNTAQAQEIDDFIKINLTQEKMLYNFKIGEKSFSLKRIGNQVYSVDGHKQTKLGELRAEFQDPDAPKNYCDDVLVAALKFDEQPYFLLSDSIGPQNCYYYMTDGHKDRNSLYQSFFSPFALTTIRDKLGYGRDEQGSSVPLVYPMFNKETKELFIHLVKAHSPIVWILVHNKGQYTLKEFMTYFSYMASHTNEIGYDIKKIEFYERDSLKHFAILDPDSLLEMSGFTLAETILFEDADIKTKKLKTLQKHSVFRVVDIKKDQDFNTWIKVKGNSGYIGWISPRAPVSLQPIQK